MNSIHLGQHMISGDFTLWESGKKVYSSIGSSITVILRHSKVLFNKKGSLSYAIKYLVEIVESDTHVRGAFSKDRLATFVVYYDDVDMRIATMVLDRGGHGMEHRLSLMPYTFSNTSGHVLTINGLLWDGRIVHVKDICA